MDTFRLETRGDVAVEVSKQPTSLTKVTITGNGSNEVPDTEWSYPASTFFKEINFHVTG